MRLKKGDTIGVVAPANFVDLNKLESAVKNLIEMGFKVKLGKNLKKRWYSFAGTDSERAEDINDFFRDKDVQGILCARGGYGSTRILELIDYEMIKKNKKPFIGYSDVTSLLLALYKKCEMESYHGPMLVSDFSGDYNKENEKYFLEVLTGKEEKIILDNFGEPLKFYNDLKGEGVLIGGNLAVLVSNLKSGYDVDYKNKILFLEDIGEDTYKIDRMLWELKNLGILDEVSGVILGDFKNCIPSSEVDFSLEDVFDFHFSNFKKPVCYNLKAGHCSPMQTLKIGGKIFIDGEKKEIIMEK